MASGGAREVYKLFIGGLTIETTEIQVEEHFSKFGFVFDILIIRNRTTGVSKGYGFISCNNVKTYQRIVNTEHVINGRAIDCHDSFKKFKENANKKIFVGGISLETTDEDLHTYFSRFGLVRQAYVIKDPVTRRSKKFGFAIMKDQTAVDAVLAVPVHSIRGIPISCKLFVRFDEESPDKAAGNQDQAQKKNNPGKGEGKIKQDQMGIYPDGSGIHEQSKIEQVFPNLVQGLSEMSSSHHPIEDSFGFAARTSIQDSGLHHNSILRDNNYQLFNDEHAAGKTVTIDEASFPKSTGQRDTGYFNMQETKQHHNFDAYHIHSKAAISGLYSAHRADCFASQHQEPGLNSPPDHRKLLENKKGFRFEDTATGVRLRETNEGTMLLRSSRTTECLRPSEARSIQALIGEYFNVRESLYRFNFCPLPPWHHIGLRHRRW
jgi:RNA recognition motif-containing protein